MNTKVGYELGQTIGTFRLVLLGIARAPSCHDVIVTQVEVTTGAKFISGGIEDLLSPEWREKESKNAVLWWNLILSFMRYRFPFTFLLQGSFSSSLIAPTPDDNLDI